MFSGDSIAAINHPLLRISTNYTEKNMKPCLIFGGRLNHCVMKQVNNFFVAFTSVLTTKRCSHGHSDFADLAKKKSLVFTMDDWVLFKKLFLLAQVTSSLVLLHIIYRKPLEQF